MELPMVDLNMLKVELAIARRARREAETAGLDLEYLIVRMQAGRSLEQIELEVAAAGDSVAEVEDFRQAA
jgi:hypothetical protein